MRLATERLVETARVGVLLAFSLAGGCECIERHENERQLKAAEKQLRAGRADEAIAIASAVDTQFVPRPLVDRIIERAHLTRALGALKRLDLSLIEEAAPHISSVDARRTLVERLLVRTRTLTVAERAPAIALLGKIPGDWPLLEERSRRLGEIHMAQAKTEYAAKRIDDFRGSCEKTETLVGAQKWCEQARAKLTAEADRRAGDEAVLRIRKGDLPGFREALATIVNAKAAGSVWGRAYKHLEKAYRVNPDFAFELLEAFPAGLLESAKAKKLIEKVRPLVKPKPAPAPAPAPAPVAAPAPAPASETPPEPPPRIPESLAARDAALALGGCLVVAIVAALWIRHQRRVAFAKANPTFRCEQATRLASRVFSAFDAARAVLKEEGAALRSVATEISELRTRAVKFLERIDELDATLASVDADAIDRDLAGLNAERARGAEPALDDEYEKTATTKRRVIEGLQAAKENLTRYALRVEQVASLFDDTRLRVMNLRHAPDGFSSVNVEPLVASIRDEISLADGDLFAPQDERGTKTCESRT